MVFIETGPCGKSSGLHGYEGLAEFFKRRKAIDMEMIERLGIDCTVIENDDYDWKKMQEKLTAVVKGLMETV